MRGWSCRAPLLALAVAVPAAADVTTHAGACDASAAVFLTPNLMLVADDEDNVLRLYETERDGQGPVYAVDLGAALRAGDDEADIEGAAWLGDRIYWIGSHGRNRKGKWRAARLRFFATRVEVHDGALDLRVAGRVFEGLLDALVADPHLRALDFPAAIGPVGENAGEALAPEQGGVNIEGLSATPDGRLLIGFRNPRPGGRALLVPLDNPAQVIEAGAAPRLGEPIQLDLGGRGVRGIEYCVPCRGFLIVAGPHNGSGGFALFRWSGAAGEAATQIRLIESLRPEGLAVAPDGRVRLLSDDGDERHPVADPDECQDDLAGGRCECKQLEDAARRRFRSTWVDLD